MKVVYPYVVVDVINPPLIMKSLEMRGRVCYKSESRITPDSADRFVAGLIKRGHESVIEHEKVSARFIVDRGVSHEIVRHRIASYSQESTRYCNYGHDKEITVIEPYFFNEGIEQNIWYQACKTAEKCYMDLIAAGATPQMARSVLPNSLKTEIEVTFNLREWRHFFGLRCSSAAHPQMQQVAIPLFLHLRARLPIIFGDIPYNGVFLEKHYADVLERSLI